ncbi:MAG TPA: ABC transporter permease [Ignavibacteriaceae bacterium]|nr:ABC transporter permease [Ignavibacteriaceae bacterium]
MKFESYIAKRYLVSKHKINFITIISFLSVSGITIGVAALIVVLSVFNGFGSLVTSFLLNFDPHVRVELISKEAISQQEKAKQIIQSDKDVSRLSPYVSGKVLVYRDNLTQVINLKGISPKEGEKLYNIDSEILYGKYDLSEKGNIPKIILGLTLADKLQAIIGDTLTIVSPVGIESAITQFSLPKSRRVYLAGIYSSNNNDYDANYIFSSLDVAQDLLGYNHRIQGYDVKLNDISSSFDFKEKLNAQLNPDLFNVETWYDFHRDLYTVMQIERWTAYIILSLIIAVATFNILGSLSMSVIEKQRDIGILRSMGATEKSILKIFRFEGMLIGIIGTIGGSLLGYFVCFLQLQYKIYPLDPTQYKIDALPLQVRLSDFFFIAGISLLLTYLSSIYPAKRAAKINPLEAIKWE